MVPRSNKTASKASKARPTKAVASTEGTQLSARDVVELGRGIAGLRGMAKNAIRLNAGLRIAQREAKTRLDHADTLEAFCLEGDVRGGRLPAKLYVSAAVALGTVRRQLETLKKTEEGFTLTPKEITDRIGYLDRIAEKMGEQLTMDELDDDDSQPSLLKTKRKGKAKAPAGVAAAEDAGDWQASRPSDDDDDDSTEDDDT